MRTNSVSPPGKCRAGRRVPVCIQKVASLLAIHDKAGQCAKQILAGRACGDGQAGVRIVDELYKPVLGQIAVTCDQGIWAGGAVVLQDQFVVLLAKPFLLLALPGDIVIAGIDPALAVGTLDQGEVDFDPEVAAAAVLQAVYGLAMAVPAGQKVGGQFLQSAQIVRMHPGRSVVPVQLPGLLRRHAGHRGKAFGQKLRASYARSDADAPRPRRRAGA